MTGLWVLLFALGFSGCAAWGIRRTNGAFRDGARADDRERLSAVDIGAELGERATLVQFSSAFCAPCRATRVLLTDIAKTVDGVATIDIDAEENLDLVRRLHIMRTPTVLVLDAAGTVSTRASGLPRREQVLAALGNAVGERQ
ncbi:thioredoxin family protein [Aeromicrobium sp.]|uniref:TlpA family protein disulfide reductase n=1 Tax=Aeromicrobium sp. TaxID=1871063 RepID=UPI00198FFC08|nr:thioredoxin family protein [Aeromicrobium sp.]MBC7633548.1 thioredoxin family protein [Aeromicrobium sp.]